MSDPFFLPLKEKAMNYILFDDHSWDQMLPLTFTHPVSELRIGILKIKEKWEKHLNTEVSFLTRQYLQDKYPANFEKDNILINSSLIPAISIIEKIGQLTIGQAIIYQNRIVAARLSKNEAKDFNFTKDVIRENIPVSDELRFIDRPWHIFTYNGEEINNDFEILTRGRKSEVLSSTNNFISQEKIFAEEGVKAEFVTINATKGPVYLGKNTEIMEGSAIRGPFALCENSIIKMSAKIYGPTTIGPMSKIGGEVNNSVIQGFSNKAHDGFLGNSVIGEWCNIGASSNNSNLKNNYANVKLWSYPENNYINTGLQFCGLIMGDHSKCGINTMFNTGTVVGVCVNLYGSGFPGNFIPSFSWGGANNFTIYSMPKAFEVAEKVMAHRNIKFDQKDRLILMEVFKLTEKSRT